MNEATRAALGTLIDAAYCCGSSPARWSHFLRDLSAFGRCCSPVIGVGSIGLRWQLVSLIQGGDEVVRPDPIFEKTVLRRVLEKSLVGCAFSIDQLAEGPMERRDFYDRWMRPRRYGSGMVIYRMLDDRLLFGMCAYRSVGCPNFGPDDFALFDALAPHVARAVLLSRRIEALESAALALETVLEPLRIGIVLVDEHQRIVAATRVARAVGSEGDGLELSHELRVFDRSARIRLADLVREVTSEMGREEPRSGGALRVPRISDRRAYELLVRPEAARDSGCRPRVPLALVVIRDPEREARIDPTNLEQLYDLTGAEARVAASLAIGLGINTIACEHHVAEQTVRNQLKAVYEKTDTHRQSELVALLRASAASFSRPKAS